MLIAECSHSDDHHHTCAKTLLNYSKLTTIPWNINTLSTRKKRKKNQNIWVQYRKGQRRHQ